jgi:ribosome biogenesis GTPase
MDLHALGWDDGWTATFAEHAAKGFKPARVVNEDKNAYLVVSEAGEHPAGISGRLHHLKRSNAELPKVGDWVALKHPAGETKGVIHAVLPRRTRIVRQNPGRAAELQLMAANVQVVFIVQALDQTFNRRRLERFLVMVHEGGARPVVLLNKCDLRDEVAARTAEAEAAAGGTTVLVTSARTGKGLGEIRALLVPRETVCFLGTSGVGKSSLINRLYGERVLATLPVRDDDAKGRHTTTRREILPLPNGTLVVDTPGMREFHLWLADDGLDQAFPEVLAWAQDCRFRDCSHGAEPGCRVKTAVDAGELPVDRYQSFRRLQEELDATAGRHRQQTYAQNRHRETTGTKAYLELGLRNPVDEE